MCPMNIKSWPQVCLRRVGSTRASRVPTGAPAGRIVEEAIFSNNSLSRERTGVGGGADPAREGACGPQSCLIKKRPDLRPASWSMARISVFDSAEKRRCRWVERVRARRSGHVLPRTGHRGRGLQRPASGPFEGEAAVGVLGELGKLGLSRCGGNVAGPAHGGVEQLETVRVTGTVGFVEIILESGLPVHNPDR